MWEVYCTHDRRMWKRFRTRKAARESRLRSISMGHDPKKIHVRKVAVPK